MLLFFHWLSHEPPIIRYVSEPETDDAALERTFPPGRVYRLPFYHWHFTADQVERSHRAALTRRPQDVVRHLTNTADLHADLTARGVPSAFVSQNAFIDEAMFLPLGTPKVHRVVYVARMSPFKRHALACQVPGLLVIGGVYGPGDSDEYFDGVRAALPGATFTQADQRHRFLHEKHIPVLLNSARVGLCLSAVEGAMYAATEYLLCGLPVVSTANVGGRDEWFDPRFCRTVPDDPAAIAAAVDELILLDIPPELVRRHTLRRLWEHRRRLLDIGQELYDAAGAGRDFARDFYARFTHRLGQWTEAA